MATGAGAAGNPAVGADGAQREVVMVGGRRVTLTHLDKVMYPETGTTKADILGYYAAVADALIRHARDRPATRKRWVHGVGTPQEPGQVFFQKNLADGTPAWVARRELPHKAHVTVYPLVNDLATLTWLAQIGTLEIHVPQWRFDAAGAPARPDRLVLDLDPGEGVGLAECAEVARWARALLLDMGLDTLPVTSGSKGIHLYAALDGSHTSEQVGQVAHELARALEADHPGEVLSAMTRSLRAGKVFVDWSQNNANKTTIAPYSLRGLMRPLVAAPRSWRELESPGLEQLDYRQVLKRLERREDLLGPVADAIDAGGAGPAARTDDDRLHQYRSKRDARRTPEPVPATTPAPGAGGGGAGGGGAGGGASFVIQEHHARAIHFDLRLEHDGVLASWALPKGVPVDPTHNHLAVQTEDHPLEYLEFEGDIPAGEYGAGSMSIWDSGSYSLQKWRDDEVIVTLQGRPDGGLAGAEREFALIRTGGAPSRNWLIHLMKPKRPGPAAGRAPGTARSDPAPAPAPDADSASAPAPTYSPMLARPGSLRELSAETEWAYEMKWDGIRALAYLEPGPAGRVRFFTRNGNEVTASFPELIDDLRAAVGTAVGRAGAVLDGEVVALDTKNRPDFSRLQTRLGVTDERAVHEARRLAPVHYFVFDLLEQGGTTLIEQPYSARRTALEDLVTATGTVQVPPSFAGDAGAVLATSLQLGLEGLIAKATDSTYSAGRRSDQWVKIKHVRTQEVVIGGWRPGNGHRGNTFGSLLVGVPEPTRPGEAQAAGRLRYAGRIGTGFRDRDLLVLRRRLDELPATANPFDDVPPEDAADAVWVQPALVGEVEFAEWTPSGRLRHPSWRGLRPDKAPGDVVREGTAPR